jgi:hypothetical protein
MKIRPVGAELLHVNRRTDMPKLTVAFRNSANVPKNVKMCWIGKEDGDRNGLTRAPLPFYTEKLKVFHSKIRRKGRLSIRKPNKLRPDFVILMLMIFKIVIIKNK